jgi:acyl dehydratase
MHDISQDLSINDIHVGDVVSFERRFSEEDVATFAELSGDHNPLHLDDEYAKTTVFGRRLVYGALVASLCSTCVGMYIPGKRCLYLSQTSVFKKPVFICDTVTLHAVVDSVSQATGVVKISIAIHKEQEEVYNGIATVQVL